MVNIARSRLFLKPREVHNRAYGVAVNDDRHGSLEEQEYFEIRLIDSSTNAKPSFLIREIHTVWSDRARQVMWNGHEYHNCRTLDEAQKCFTRRKGFILAKGFTSFPEIEFRKAS